jgi:hypothetical protein
MHLARNGRAMLEIGLLVDRQGMLNVIDEFTRTAWRSASIGGSGQLIVIAEITRHAV